MKKMRVISFFNTIKRGIALVDKHSSKLEVNEGTYCRRSGRFNGVSIGRDKNGYFVFTHRARSKSYDSVGKIPNSVIKYIESTG